jgi:exodeoxyribonuclease V beta subunit
MKEAMLHHGYHLQYYIYAVALKRWLEKTQENFNFTEKFGGVYYVFIRGVNEENGIYFVNGKDIASSIEKMDEIFNGGIK